MRTKLSIIISLAAVTAAFAQAPTIDKGTYIRDATTPANKATVTSGGALQVTQGGTTSTSGTLQSAATATGNGTVLTVDGYSAAALTVNCASCSGGTTVNFEVSEDGTNWSAQYAVQVGTTTIASSTTTAGVTVWETPVGGFKQLRARISGYSAGTVTVTAHAVAVTYNAKITSTNIGSVGGTAVASATPGVQKVGVVGNAGAAVDAATNASPPANGVQTLGVAATSLPSAATNGNTVAAMRDKYGRAVVLSQAPRDLIKPAAVQTTDTSSHNLLAAQGSGVFADLQSLTVTTETATATVVSLSDGTTTYKISIPATIGQGAHLAWPVPIPATSSNTAWTVTSSASVTLDFIAEFVLNK